MSIRRLPVSMAMALCLLGAAPSWVFADDQQPSAASWQFLRDKYYGDKEMGVVDEAHMSIEAPANTPDPAATPLTLRFAREDGRHPKRVRVFIDNNPAPLVATFEFPDAPTIVQIDMRVRVDRFTSVRAIAEESDGSLEMRSSWVKAAGGCSAPPSPAAGGTLGEVRVRPAADAKAVQVSIRHPNSSGFQIDPRTGDNIPAHYISHLVVSAGGKPLLEAETGISLSENPSLRIATETAMPLPITVDALDSVSQAHYSAVLTASNDLAAHEGH